MALESVGDGLWDMDIRTGLDGDSIVVEITESLLLSGGQEVVEQLLGLRDDGIQVSLDDFGTGWNRRMIYLPLQSCP